MQLSPTFVQFTRFKAMKPLKPGMFFTLLMLGALILTACQPAADQTANAPTAPASPTAQAVEATQEVMTPNPTATADTSTQTSDGMRVPDGWQSFYNSTQGYTLAYPPQWGMCEELQHSRIFCEFQPPPPPMGPLVRLYVSVYPQDNTGQDGQAFNFTPFDSIQKFNALPVGESMLKVPDAIPPEAFTYTRLPDRMVAGQVALVIENAGVWEAPVGTKDRGVVFVSQGMVVHLGTFYETPEQLAMFEQVLDSFRLSP